MPNPMVKNETATQQAPPTRPRRKTRPTKRGTRGIQGNKRVEEEEEAIAADPAEEVAAEAPVGAKLGPQARRETSEDSQEKYCSTQTNFVATSWLLG